MKISTHDNATRCVVTCTVNLSQNIARPWEEEDVCMLRDATRRSMLKQRQAVLHRSTHIAFVETVGHAHLHLILVNCQTGELEAMLICER